MNRVCEHCDALHWISKRRYQISFANLKWKSCCKENNVVLLALRDFSQLLRELLIKQNSRERDFRQNIRSFNFAFIFTFVNYKTNSRIANWLNNDRESVVFQIQKKLCIIFKNLCIRSRTIRSFLLNFFFTIRMKRSQHEMHNIRN
jgi:hypothetical protein